MAAGEEEGAHVLPGYLNWGAPAGLCKVQADADLLWDFWGCC